MSLFLTVYSLISIFLVIAVAYAMTAQVAMSFTFGALMNLVNLLLLAWAWRLIFQKKLIALAVSVIVFKYAILGAIIYFSIRRQWVSVEWMAGGLSVLLPSVVVFAVLHSKRNR